MTDKELKSLESELQKRRYSRYDGEFPRGESWGWSKAFGEKANEYLIEFHVRDLRPYYFLNGDPYGFDMWTALKNHQKHYLKCSWEPICDIDTFERMAAEFNQMVRRYINPEKEER